MILKLSKSRWQLWIETEIDFRSREITQAAMDRDNHERPGAKDGYPTLGCLVHQAKLSNADAVFSLYSLTHRRSPTLTP